MIEEESRTPEDDARSPEGEARTPEDDYIPMRRSICYGRSTPAMLSLCNGEVASTVPGSTYRSEKRVRYTVIKFYTMI